MIYARLAIFAVIIITALHDSHGLNITSIITHPSVKPPRTTKPPWSAWSECFADGCGQEGRTYRSRPNQTEVKPCMDEDCTTKGSIVSSEGTTTVSVTTSSAIMTTSSSTRVVSSLSCSLAFAFFCYLTQSIFS